MLSDRKGYSVFLTNFIKKIEFLANSKEQEVCWIKNKSCSYSEIISIFLHESNLIIQNKDNYNLRSYEFEKLSQFYTIVNFFSFTQQNPGSKKEYEDLIFNPKWIEIQKGAKELYNFLKYKIK